MIKRLIYIIIRSIEWINYSVHRLISNFFPRNWKREGECLKCGKCCETPNLSVNPYYKKIPFLLSIFLIYHRYVNKLKFVAYHEELKQIEFICLNYDKESKLCIDYCNRPVFCRTFPRIETWFRKPKFIEGCGYYAVHKSQINLNTIEKFSDDLTDEEKEKLEKYLQNGGKE